MIESKIKKKMSRRGKVKGKGISKKRKETNCSENDGMEKGENDN